MADRTDRDAGDRRSGDGDQADSGPARDEPGDREPDHRERAGTEPEPEPREDRVPAGEDAGRDGTAAGWGVLFPAGVVVGVVAFALGYLVTYTVASGPIRNSAIGTVAGDDVWRLVGWVFFNAHLVDTVGAVSTLGIEVGGAVNVIDQVEAFPTALYAVPPAVLLLAGGLTAHRLARRASLSAAVRAGVSVIPGYLVPVVVGAFLFRVTSGPGAVGPEPVTATFLAGIVYPLVFGVVGAVVGSRL